MRTQTWPHRVRAGPAGRSVACVMAAAILCLSWTGLAAQAPEPPEPPGPEPLLLPASLKGQPVPEPPNLMDYVADRAAAIQLGKALFWDMQAGSDGIQACASCHFQAGQDVRSRNSLNPCLSGGDTAFQLGGPNYQLQAADYPFHRLANPDDRHSAVLFDTNDITGSQGVFVTGFNAVRVGFPFDAGTPWADLVFQVQGVTVRRVEPVNSPSTINAIFNYTQFWDGRANFYFNGTNALGPLDTRGRIFVREGAFLVSEVIRLPYASLASQAAGPGLSDFEMSYGGRTWPDVGRKLLNLRPLAAQKVHPQDSVLGALSRARLRFGTNELVGRPGLDTTYGAMVRKAFRPEYWDSRRIVRFVDGVPQAFSRPNRPLEANEFTHIEANFSLFWGLAIQMYEATLVSDETPFDRYLSGDSNALTDDQKAGMAIFFGAGKCRNCHSGPELTSASVRNAREEGTMNVMLMGDGGMATYDEGFYNVGIRPTEDFPGRDGDSTPFINPLTGLPYPLSFTKLAFLKRDGLLPPEVAQYVDTLPASAPARITVRGSCKTPSLRNVELTGPYFRNGGYSTLFQAVEFYTRGADFNEANIADLAPDVGTIGPLVGSLVKKNQLVAFLMALTDERVRKEQAPFDHPQLLIPNGQMGDQNAVTGSDLLLPNGFKANEIILELPAVGAGGRPAMALPNLVPYLNLPQTQP